MTQILLKIKPIHVRYFNICGKKHFMKVEVEMPILIVLAIKSPYM
jgi:hypothetical protein